MSDPAKEIVIEELLAAIADVEKTDSVCLNMSLHDYVSTDAIQSLETHKSNAWRLQFETENHVIEVTGNNIIVVDGQQVREFA